MLRLSLFSSSTIYSLFNLVADRGETCCCVYDTQVARCNRWQYEFSSKHNIAYALRSVCTTAITAYNAIAATELWSLLSPDDIDLIAGSFPPTSLAVSVYFYFRAVGVIRPARGSGSHRMAQCQGYLVYTPKKNLLYDDNAYLAGR